MKDSSTATERVGRYQLLEPIGGGPNGIVARAKVFGVAGFERQFAVKRFLPELTVGAAAQALSAAARSYGSLEHPRIARMSEFGVAQGQTFTAVEYVPGLDVFRLLQEAKLASVAIAAGGALALVSQAARAVGYAHGRGLSHLGLAPTNVIVTADGDVKVTDFGILASTMPAQPAEQTRLASRVPYLAPEQIAGEATSAATDVFVLGVIAYELVTGQRAYRGDSPATIAQAILAGPPAEPALPRPIVRVLQRCLARSPFERFPDARALADALDAALRVAPVPGTRKDVGAQVKTTLERYAQLNEGNVSGMVALNLQGSLPSEEREVRPEARTEPVAIRVVGPGPSSTARDIPRLVTTQPGLAPPPIPVPPGVAPPPMPAGGIPPGPSTIPGFKPADTKKPQIPSIGAKKPTSSPSIKPPPAPPPAAPKVGSLTQGWDAMPDLEATSPATPAAPAPAPNVARSLTQGWDAMPEPELELGSPSSTVPSAAFNDAAITRPAAPAIAQSLAAMSADPVFEISADEPSQKFESQTGEMSVSQINALNERAAMATADLAPITRPEVTRPSPLPETHHDPGDTGDFAAEPEPSSTMPSLAPPPPQRSNPQLPINAPSSSQSQPHAKPMAPASSSRMPLIAGIVLGIGVLGAGGYILYSQVLAKKSPDTTTVAKGSGVTPPAPADAAALASAADATSVAVAPTVDAMVAMATIDAAAVATVEPDAATAPIDAAVVATVTPDAAADNSGDGDKPKATASGTSDQLEVSSTPAGARVFVDGAELGRTPVKVPGSADHHSMAVYLPGHELYLAEVDGHGKYDVALKPVKAAKAGPGIKVETCKVKDRYYIYVDGIASGQTCPTSKRIVVNGLGKHVVEVYDMVTENRKTYNVDIQDDRLSFRVKIEE